VNSPWRRAFLSSPARCRRAALFVAEYADDLREIIKKLRCIETRIQLARRDPNGLR